MKIDNAIDKLSEFRKLAKKFGDDCELVGFDDDSFTFKVQFTKPTESRKTIVGFASVVE